MKKNKNLDITCLLLRACSLSCLIDLRQIEGVMRIEYYLGIKTSTRSDFLEGVRAVLIDKDQVYLISIQGLD